MDAVRLTSVPDRPRGLGRVGTFLAVVAMAVVIGIVAFVVDTPSGSSAGGSGPAGAPAVGQPAPNLSVTSLDGQTVSLAALQGKAVWLTFGASWCPDCRAEAADLEAAYVRHQAQGLAVISVFNEDGSTAGEYARKAGFTFPMVADPSGDLGDRFHVVGLPTHLFIGRDGIVKEVRIGRLTPDDMEQLVSELLGS